MIVSFPRHVWGARYGAGPLDPGPEQVVVIHHTHSPGVLPGASLAAEVMAVRSIERYHVESKKWAAVGYNFVVTPNGHIYEGRGWERAGAHAGTSVDNFRSIGIAYLADGNTLALTEAALEAIGYLIETGVRDGHLDRNYRLTGHRDHKATDCPGALVYAQLDAIRAGVA